jgi:outer membrane receptor protein involved in Fe transport
MSRDPRRSAPSAFAARTLGWALLGVGASAGANDVEEIRIIGVTPTEGAELDFLKIPSHVQAGTSEDLERMRSLDLTDYMNRALGSVSINSAQNNPLQPDVQFRGFTASPLLGLPQGLAVYQDGARINEPFGDAVNWDLLPESAVAGITLMGGANPVFGLNTLGGALVVDMKTGFSYEGHDLDVSSGSWGRTVASAESGGNNGSFGYYVNASYFEEDGWRDLSDSDATNLYGSVSWESDTSSFELGAQYGDSRLTGNGPAPVGLVAIDREAIFTAPDITENNLRMVTLEGTHDFTESVSFASSAFYRSNETESFNGDASEFLVCTLGNGDRLLEGLEEDELEEVGVDEDDLCEGDFADAEALEDFLNGFGSDEEFDIEDLTDDVSGTGILSDEAINNISTRDQRSWGGDLQVSFTGDVGGRDNLLVLGAGWFDGHTDFDAVVELAGLDPVTRSTTGLGTGAFVDEEATLVDTDSRSYSLYFTDTLSATEKLSFTFAGRFNDTRIQLADRSGERPELNGDHSFDRFNPAVGLTWQASPRINLYGSYSESARAPTPIELACNEEVFDLARQIAIEEGEDPGDVELECRLPNAFLADPPLEQVVAHSFELGVRGRAGAAVDYHIGLFHTTNEDDILFQTTGRSAGLFANVDETRRQGLEARLSGSVSSLDWYAAYALVQATFEDTFDVLSPNHPAADDDGRVAVSPGDSIPGIPEHQLKLGGDWSFAGGWSIGAEAIANSGQFLRGDESNQLDELDGYALVNLRAAYRWERVEVYARIDNIFDQEYESFGLLGEDPTEVLPDLADERPVFVGAGAPRAGWLGFRLSL